MIDDDAPEPLARKTHPDTSLDAARNILPKLKSLQAEALGYLVMAPGMTASELAAKFKLRDPRHVGRRLPELVALGHAYRGEPRTCGITGRTATTWYPTNP